MFGDPFVKKSPKISNTALPVGVPFNGAVGAMQSNTQEGTGSDPKNISPHVLKKEIEKSEAKVEGLKKVIKESEAVATHAGNLIESFLFPPTITIPDEEGVNQTIPSDLFSTLDKEAAWDMKYEPGLEEDFSDGHLENV